MDPTHDGEVVMNGAPATQIRVWSFGPAVRFSVVTYLGLRSTSVGRTKNGAIRIRSVKTRNARGTPSRKNNQGMPKKQERGPRIPTSHAIAYPRKKLNRTASRVYSGDTSSAAPQWGHRKSKRKTDRDTSTAKEHAGHATDLRSNMILRHSKIGRLRTLK